MNSRNREQKYLEIKKKKVYKCFNIPFHVTTIHRQPSWLTFITIRGFFGVSLIYHTMEVKSLGRLKTIRDSLTPPQPHPTPPPPPLSKVVFSAPCPLYCVLNLKCLLIPTLFRGGRGRSLEASKLLQQRILCLFAYLKEGFLASIVALRLRRFIQTNREGLGRGKAS